MTAKIPETEPCDPWPEGSVAAGLSGEWGESDATRNRYERRSLLGIGGMGTVYLAHDLLLRRDVALKVALAPPNGACAQRLQREARIIGALDHPGIVAVHDFGIDDEGLPWYVMRVVSGLTLSQAIAQADLEQDRARLVRSLLAACEAVAHAHARGVIHRDLKPGNILVGQLGEAVVMDWGLARPILSHSDEWSEVLPADGQTVAGSVLGTPSYMSPEQAAGDTVGRPCDVWALGICLYQVLVGVPPFGGDDARAILAKVLHQDVPDAAVAGVRVPLELAAIVRRATAKEPAKRYRDAGKMAEDLAAWVNGDRVGAHTYTAVSEVGRALRRYRQAFIAAVVLGLAAAILVSLAWWQTTEQRDRALEANQSEVQARAQSERSLASSLVAQARASASTHARGEAETLAAHALMTAETSSARGLLMSSAPRPQLVSFLPAPAGCLDLELAPSGDAVACRKGDALDLIELPSGKTRWSVPTQIAQVMFTAEGHPYGWVDMNSTMSVFDVGHGGAYGGPELVWDQRRPAPSRQPGTLARSGGSVLTLLDRSTGLLGEEPFDAMIHAAMVAEDGAMYVATIVGMSAVDSVGVRHDWPTPWKADGPPFSMDVSKDGRFIALGFLEGYVRIFHVDGTLVAERFLRPGMIHSVRWSAGDERLVAIDERGSPWILAAPDLSSAIRLPGTASAAEFQPTGDLAVASHEGVHFWKLPDGSAVPSMIDAIGGVTNLDWRGTHVAASLGAGRLALYNNRVQVDAIDIASGTAAKDVALSPDGSQLIGVSLQPSAVRRSADGVVHRNPWGRGTPPAGRVMWLQPDLIVLGARADGPLVRRLGGQELGALQQPGLSVVDAEPNHDRTRAVLLGSNERIYVIDAGDEPTIEPRFRVDSSRAVAMVGNTDRLLVATKTHLQLHERDGTVVWSRPTGVALRDVACSPDGTLVAAGERAGLARIWRVEDGVELAVLSGHQERVQSVVFSPDGRTLATGSWDETVRFWDLTRLRTPAAELLEEVEGAWGLTLEEALGR